MGRRVRSVVGPALAAFLLTALLTGCGATQGPDGGSARSSASGSGPGSVHTALKACPQQTDRPATGDSTLPKRTFPCLGGGALDLSKAPGVPTVVTLWGSWCPSCREELPTMQRLVDAAAGKVRVVGVISKDGVPQAESFAEDAKVTFPSAFDGQGQLMTDLGLHGLPYTYFLDANGAVVHTQVGSVGTADQLEQLVATHLGVRL
jgi:cytochrome c biogenesis protein CcmG, thiol:disulfide interchange protein DsbE